MISPRNLRRRVTVFAAVSGLLIAASFFLMSAPAFTQTQSSQAPAPPQQETPPEAGGPQGSTSPIAVPKKKEEPPPPPKPKVKNPEGLGDYSLQVSVPLVNVPVLVTTHHGEFIPGLQKDNFRVSEDGVMTDWFRSPPKRPSRLFCWWNLPPPITTSFMTCSTTLTASRNR